MIDHKLDIEPIKGLFREKGYRWTNPREECLRALAESESPLTVVQIYQKLSNKEIDVVSIYRNMQIFSALGIACKVDHVSQGQRYKISDAYQADHKHHHHLICRMCGKAEDFEGCFIDQFVKKIFNQKGFQVMDHQLNFMGSCKSCSALA